MSDALNREIRLTSQPKSAVRRGRNIVAVVGIDKYQHLQILHNAVGDAKGVRELFKEQLGFQEVTPPLFDAQATRDAIHSMVVDSLAEELKPDDSLLFFFAGHGHTEKRTVGTRTKQTGYLIPVEGADPDEKKFSSYLRLDALLEEIAGLPALHILVILDACHSGFALGESVQVLRDTQRYSDDLSKRMSRRIIASAMTDQPALDNGPVSGHSLFTGTLVEALALGQADEDNKGFVTSSEIAIYVQRKVASWSNSQQTPDFGSFDLDDRGELVISLVGETQSRLLAHESLAIADTVFELGRLTGDPKRFLFAARQYRDALRHALLGKMELSAAEIGLGKALLAGGETGEAVKALGETVDQSTAKGQGEAAFYLGLALAKNRAYAETAKQLQAWQKANPKHDDAAWAQEYIAWLRSAAATPLGRRRALLIGINEYELGRSYTLNGCVNDVTRLVEPLLKERFNFAQEDIQLLTDVQATRANVLSAFEALKTESAPGDALLIYYSGHSVPPDDAAPQGDDTHDAFWILHDTKDVDGKLVNGIAALELHRLIMEIPATHKTLILDTHSNWSLVSQAENEGGYNLIVASDSGELAYEARIKIDRKVYPCGMLSMALYKTVMDAPPSQLFTYDEWINRAALFSQEASASAGFERQTPLFIGERDQQLFGRYDPYLFAFEFSQRRGWPETSIPQLLGRYNRFHALIKAPFAAAYYAFGCAFAEKGLVPQALIAFQAAVEQSHGRTPATLRMLAATEALAGHLGAAQKLLTQLIAAMPANEQAPVEQMVARLTALSQLPKRLILVLRGFPEQAARDSLQPALAALDAQLRQLYGQAGYQVESIYLVETEYEQLRKKLDATIDQLAGQPLLLCVLGGVKWILGDLIEKRWQQLSGQASITVWAQSDIVPPPSKSSKRKRQKEKELAESTIVTTSVVANSLQLLAQAFAAIDPQQSSSGDFAAKLKALIDVQAQGQPHYPKPLIRSLNDSYPFLGSACPQELVLEIQQVGEKSLAEIAAFLQEVAAKREARKDLWPEGRLQLGIAYAALKDYPAARRTLDEVIRICESGGKFMEQVAIAA